MRYYYSFGIYANEWDYQEDEEDEFELQDMVWF